MAISTRPGQGGRLLADAIHVLCQVSFVNSINTIKGGTHVSHVKC